MFSKLDYMIATCFFLNLFVQKLFLLVLNTPAANSSRRQLVSSSDLFTSLSGILFRFCIIYITHKKQNHETI